jgi:hypothetical protein
MSEVYIRDLEDGTVQRANFEDDPGKSTPQWRLESAKKPSPKKKAAPKKKAKK